MTIEEIRDPGVKRRFEDEKNRKRQDKLASRRNRMVFGTLVGESSDEEDGVAGVWSMEEDNKLKEYFELYKDDPALLEKLSNILDMDLNSTRTARVIRKRLQFLELIQKPKKRPRRVVQSKNKAAPKKVKIDSVQPTLINIINQGKDSNESESLDWLASKLSDLSITMNKDKEDLAIVPIERQDFDHLEQTSIGQIFGALHFRKPGPWWKIPYSYNKKEIMRIIRLIRDNLDGTFENEDDMDDSEVAALVAESTALIRNIAHSKVIDGEMVEQHSPSKVNSTPQRGRKRPNPFSDSDSDDEMQLQQLRKRGRQSVSMIADDSDSE